MESNSYVKRPHFPRIAPDSTQARAVVPLVVKALRLRNFDKPDRDPIEEGLHQLAKKALGRGGKPVAVPLAQTCVVPRSRSRPTAATRPRPG